MMNGLHFRADDWTVTLDGETIQLLPKEYALLDYLRRHEGRTFTRAQLLDAVWPLEDPVDRTVDDHVYRLRKKLKKWEHRLLLETVRGRGYRLMVNVETAEAHPLQDNAAFAAQLEGLFRNYQRHGQGDSMRMLAEHPQVFGATLDSAMVRFMQGDAEWLLEHKEIEQGDQIVYLLFLYYYMSDDAANTLRHFEKALASVPLHQGHYLDLKMNVVVQHVENGNMEQARVVLKETQEAIRGHADLTGFLLFVHLNELLVHLEAGDTPEIERVAAEIDTLFERYPYRRELGQYQLLRGFHLFRQGRCTEAEQLFDQGIDTLKNTRFLPHLYTGLRIFRGMLRRMPASERETPQTRRLAAAYGRLWDEYATANDFDAWEKRIDRELRVLLP